MIDNDAPPPVRFTDHIKASLKRKLQVYLDRSVVWTKARWVRSIKLSTIIT